MNFKKCVASVRIAVFSGVFIALTTTGCGSSQPTKFFSLTADAAPVDHPAAAVVGLKSVELPEYLNNDFVPIFISQNEVARDEFTRWSAPFRDLVTDALVGGMAKNGVPGVLAEPWPGFYQPDCYLWVRVQQLRVSPGHDISSSILWSLVPVREARPSRRAPITEVKNFFFTQPLDNDSPAEVAAKTGAIFSMFATELSAAVKGERGCQAQYIDK